jgi:protocatechuate 3,4-dioxygenase beta subunit
LPSAPAEGKKERMSSTRGPVFVLALVGAIALGAGIAWWLEGDGERGSSGTRPGAEAEGERAPGELDGASLPEGESLRVAGRPGSASAARAAPPELAMGTLRGRVRDARGTPLGGARVALTRPEARTFDVLDAELARTAPVVDEARSGADGGFAFTLARGMPVDVLAELTGHASALVTDAYAGQELELVLEPGILVHGHITRARDGEPVPGARVRVFHLGGPASLERETTSGPDGAYELRTPVRTDGQLEVVPEGLQCSGWLALTPGPGERCLVDVALEDGVLVRGRVSAADTGAPIAGATVGEGWWYRRTTTTDARGEYELAGFGDPGVRELGARAPGYGAARVERSPAPVDGVVRVDFTLTPARAVRGRVVDGAGAPLEGAYVAAVASEFDEQGQHTDWLATRTDAAGRYRIGDLARELGHSLLVSLPGYGTQVHDFPESELETDELELADIVLRGAALVAGTVEDPAGNPLVEVEVQLEGTNHDRYRFTSAPTARARFYVDQRRVKSDARGRFWFGDLAAGRYQLVARVPGRPESAPLELEVVTGERKEGVRLRLDSGGTVRGEVVGEDGAPLAGVYVSAQGERLRDPSARPAGHVHVKTGPDGAFVLEGLPAGEYTLRAYPLETPPAARGAPWLPATVEHVATGAQPLRIELARGAAIAGRVLDARGAPAAGLVVTATAEDGGAEEFTTTDLAGAFAITVPRGTRWKLAVRGAPQSADFQRVFLERPGVAAGTGELVLRLE